MVDCSVGLSFFVISMFFLNFVKELTNFSLRSVTGCNLLLKVQRIAKILSF